MSKPEFVYTTYIRTTPEKLWDAITNPEFTRQYWAGMENISDWKKGSEWRHLGGASKPTVRVTGKVLESNPPTRLVLTWAEPDDLSDMSRVTFEIKQIEGEQMVCLNVVHDDFVGNSGMMKKISGGWPRVLSSLKSFLETGAPLNVMCMK